MTFRPKAIWRIGLPGLLVISVVSAVAQREWSALGGAIVLYGGFGAMAWRWRVEVTGRRVVVTRLRTVTFDLDDTDATIEQVLYGVIRHLVLTKPGPKGYRVALLLYWWADWRALADLAEARRVGLFE